MKWAPKLKINSFATISDAILLHLSFAMFAFAYYIADKTMNVKLMESVTKVFVDIGNVTGFILGIICLFIIGELIRFFVTLYKYKKWKKM